jgi:hypothetical protein
MSNNSRQRLCPWLVAKIEGGEIPGLCWINEEKTRFQISWIHKSKAEWNPESCQLFEEWEKCNGRYQDGKGKPDYPGWKTRMRSALCKSKDFKLIKEANPTDLFRIYELVTRQEDERKTANGQNSSQHQSPSSYNEPSTNIAATGTCIPLSVAIEDYKSEEGTYVNDTRYQHVINFDTTTTADAIDSGRLPSDLNNMSTSDMLQFNSAERQAFNNMSNVSIDDVDMVSESLQSMDIRNKTQPQPAQQQQQATQQSEFNPHFSLAHQELQPLPLPITMQPGMVQQAQQNMSQAGIMLPDMMLIPSDLQSADLLMTKSSSASKLDWPEYQNTPVGDSFAAVGTEVETGDATLLQFIYDVLEGNGKNLETAIDNYTEKEIISISEFDL